MESLGSSREALIALSSQYSITIRSIVKCVSTPKARVSNVFVTRGGSVRYLKLDVKRL